MQGAEADPRVPREQFEHLVPSLPVKALADQAERPVGWPMAVESAERDRDPGQPEEERAVLDAVGLRGECIRRPGGGLAVTVVAEVLVRLVQRQGDPGQSVVKGRVRESARAQDQPIDGLAGQVLDSRCSRGLIWLVHTPTLPPGTVQSVVVAMLGAAPAR